MRKNKNHQKTYLSGVKVKKKPPENLAFCGKTKRNPQENQFYPIWFFFP